jgi:hypothetical protein
MTCRRIMTVALTFVAAGLLASAVSLAADPPKSSPGAPAKPGAGDKLAAPAEQMDNPQFTAWNKFDVGASSTLITDIEGASQGISMQLQTVQKLVEKTADHLVVESTPSMKVGDNVRQLPAQRQTVQAKIEKKEFKKLPDEQVTAAGQTFTCKVYQAKQPTPRGGGEVDAKVWYSDKVPGGTVKLEGNAAKAKFTMLLKSYSEK